jgi:hypothetical protein
MKNLLHQLVFGFSSCPVTRVFADHDVPSFLSVKTPAFDPKDVFWHKTDEQLTSILNYHRHLQNSPVSPEEVCAEFNNRNETNATQLDCTCRRYDERDTLVECDFMELSCNDDNSICYTGSFQLLLNETLNSKVVTTCSNRTVPVSPKDNTCIRIFPVAAGNYSEIESCSATYNDEVCNYCVACDKEPGVNMSSITVNCCNVETDKVQTCGPVNENGATGTRFDFIAEEDQGKCEGDMDPPSYGVHIGSSPVILVMTAIPLLTTLWWFI